VLCALLFGLLRLIAGSCSYIFRQEGSSRDLLAGRSFAEDLKVDDYIEFVGDRWGLGWVSEAQVRNSAKWTAVYEQNEENNQFNSSSIALGVSESLHQSESKFVHVI
jgi:hypothetical protein